MKRRVGRFKFPKPELVSLGLRSALCALLCAGVLVVFLFSFGGGEGRKISQVCPELERDADIPAIRGWMESYRKSVDISAEVEERGSERIHIDDDKLPECITVLKPLSVSYDAEMQWLRLRYSDGFWYWGLIIAAEDSAACEDDGQYSELEPGVWVWATLRD